VLLSIGGHPIGAARVEDALFLALSVLIVGLLVQSITHDLWLSVIAQLVLGCSVLVDVSSVGTVAASLFFTVVALAAVVSHLDRPRNLLLIVAALAIGLATLERFADGGLIIWGVLALRHRRRDAIVLFVTSSLPLSGWLAYEKLSGHGTGHPIRFHFMAASFVADARGVADWIEPSHAPKLLAVLGVVAIFVVVFAAVRHNPIPSARVLILFAVVQVVFLELSVTFYDAAVRNPDQLIPVLAAVVMAMACVIDRKTLIRALAVLAAAACLTRAIAGLPDVPSGFASTNWVHSPIVEAVETLPPRSVIYTNAPDVIYLLDGRAVSSIPETTDLSTLVRNPRFTAELAEIDRTLSTRGGFVVFVRGLDRPFLPSESSLVHLLDLRIVRNTASGAIYAVSKAAGSNPH
jgi:hypothetical protein